MHSNHTAEKYSTTSYHTNAYSYADITHTAYTSTLTFRTRYYCENGRSIRGSRITWKQRWMIWRWDIGPVEALQPRYSLAHYPCLNSSNWSPLYVVEVETRKVCFLCSFCSEANLHIYETVFNNFAHYRSTFNLQLKFCSTELLNATELKAKKSFTQGK
jgi:hypothetical protein